MSYCPNLGSVLVPDFVQFTGLCFLVSCPALA